jgi:uncharacterized repeat protein (TIGR01451 family)/MYXO-CTERM domain-containing protein
MWIRSVQADSELRFSSTAAGNVVATGNALGLSKQLNANGPGIVDGVGTFTCLDDDSVDDMPQNLGNPWWAGTTNDWTENGAAADLVLPDDSEILYAELLWGGSWAYGAEDVSAHLDHPVSLSFGNDTMEAAPDPETALTLDEFAQVGFQVRYYMRSVDVTDFVALHGAGSYAVSGVPATQYHLINSLNAAGWTLVVAYRNSSEPIRHLTVLVGGSFVDEDSIEDYPFAGFCTPPSGEVTGRIVISAIEGDANLAGDSVALAEDHSDEGAFVLLEGPNNPAENFFASQINGPDGNLDTSGTFGTLNHDAALGTNVAGARQSWDVTSVPVSSAEGHLAAGQTTAVLRTQTTGDSYVPILAGFAVRVSSPNFSGEGTGAVAEPGAIAFDDTSTVTVDLENAGMVTAAGIVFRAPLPEGLVLEGFSLDGVEGDVNGNPVGASDLENGVAIGEVGPGATLGLQMVVRSAAPPNEQSGNYVIQPTWDYDYISCVGEPPLTEPHVGSPVTIEFYGHEGTTSTTGDSSSTSAGETSGSSSSSRGDESVTGGDGTSDSDSSSSESSFSTSAGETSGSSSTSSGNEDTGGATSGDTGSAGRDDDAVGCGCTTSEPRVPWALVGLVLLRRRYPRKR